MYLKITDTAHGQPTSLRIKRNIDDLHEHQERHQCMTTEENERLTPAQRRRKAQNRNAYVTEIPAFSNDCFVDKSHCLQPTSISQP